MRAAVIFGPGSSEKGLRPFQKNSSVDWRVGMPRATSEADVVFIFGGDGTIHRHLSQLVELNLPVLVVPCGSGNDFARALGLRRVGDSRAAWQTYSGGGTNVRKIDLGTITEQNSLHYFAGVAGIGLDGEVARRANRLPRWLRGHGGYALSLPGALLRFAALPGEILTFDETTASWTTTHTEKPLVLAAFANGPFYGGGMQIAPNARLDDGQLDICLVTDISSLKLFWLFPTVYFGRHLGRSEVKYFRADRLRLATEQPLDVYADGEFVCRTPVEVGVRQGALQMVVPE